MSRQSWIYPSDGSEPYLKGARYVAQADSAYPVVIPDQPDFVSPLDGRVYSGRAGMREHNIRHNVVSNRDLTGLPILTGRSDQRSEQAKRQDAAARKELIVRQVMGY